MDKPVILEGLYSAILMAHLLITFMLVGAMTHNLLIVVKYVRGRFGRKKLEWLYVRVMLWSYLLVYVSGALIYPAFRVHIRAGTFDPRGWPTGLFEVKEHWGALGMALLVVYYLLRRNCDPEQERDKLWFYVPLCVIINLIVWYKVIAGCHLSNLKGSW